MRRFLNARSFRFSWLNHLLIGPQMLVFVPAAIFGTYWQLGDVGLSVTAFVLPMLLMLALIPAAREFPKLDQDRATIIRHQDFVKHIAASEARNRGIPEGQALFSVEIDEIEALVDRHGANAVDSMFEDIIDTLEQEFRNSDLIRRIGENRVGLYMCQSKAMDLSNVLKIATRIQTVIEQPLKMEESLEWIHSCIGIAVLAHVVPRNITHLTRASELALLDAKRAGRGSIKVFSQNLMIQDTRKKSLLEDAVRGLELGEITSYYQPQIELATGTVTGLETLARWIHPKRGIVSPADFIPQLHRARQMERLSQLMTTHALMTIRDLDRIGLHVPTVSINASGTELSSQFSVDKIAWDLDRFKLSPDRLSIEVLETVIAQGANKQLEHNLEALSQMGCKIDLDDFGTGYSSITSIRNFAISRLKIDRSFVHNINSEIEQAKMMDTFCTIANRLNLDLLAEGIETAEEMAALAERGILYGQGYFIAKPMDKKSLITWLEQRERSNLCA